MLVEQATGEFFRAGICAALGHWVVWTLYAWSYTLMLGATLLIIYRGIHLPAVIEAHRQGVYVMTCSWWMQDHPWTAGVLACVMLWTVYSMLYGILLLLAALFTYEYIYPKFIQNRGDRVFQEGVPPAAASESLSEKGDDPFLILFQ